jgi:exopolysaccharide biosynthesis WecB/TagA/CpsF family protein
MIAHSEERVNLLNIYLDNLSKNELLAKLADGGMVVTPNVDHLMKLQKDPEFHQVYRKSDYVVCDSKILFYASRMLGQPIQEKISGSDLFPAFYQYYKDDEDVTIFLLGGTSISVQVAKRKINQRVGREMVVDVYSPPFGFENDVAENEKIVALINNSQANVLAVGLGAPKQEKWIYKYKQQLPDVKTFLPIGATINFEAGNVPRSPQWMSEVGLEWMYRLMSEPQRLWKRYLIEDLPFGWLLIQQMLNRYEYNLPIGQLLQEADLLSSEQVEIILAAQAHNQYRKFGELVVEQGWLQSNTLDFFAEQFPQLHRKRSKQPLGEYLKAAALLNERQIHDILLEQSQYGRRFGEIAVNKGWVPQGTVSLLLGNNMAQAF